jgi:hypothetical protein
VTTDAKQQLVDLVRAMDMAERTAILATIAVDVLNDTNPVRGEQGSLLRLPWLSREPKMLLLFAAGDVADMLEAAFQRVRGDCEIPREVTIDIPRERNT